MASYSPEEDMALVAQCAAGDPEAWKTFMHAYGRLIHHVANRLKPDAVQGIDVEDTVGHVYEKLLENQCGRLRAWRGHAKLSTYLALVARNLILDFLASRSKGPRLHPLEYAESVAVVSADPGEQEITSLRLRALREAMLELSPGQALIVKLRLQGMSLREIAAMLKRPVGTVSVENSRALARLREKMLAPPASPQAESRGRVEP